MELFGVAAYQNPYYLDFFYAIKRFECPKRWLGYSLFSINFEKLLRLILIVDAEQGTDLNLHTAAEV